MHHTGLQPHGGEHPFTRLDARVKFLSTLALLVMVISANGVAFPLLVAGVALALCLCLGVLLAGAFGQSPFPAPFPLPPSLLLLYLRTVSGAISHGLVPDFGSFCFPPARQGDIMRALRPAGAAGDHCRVACPVCYCKECVFLTNVFEHDPDQYLRWAKRKGMVKMPTDTVFYHITRMVHMSTACVGCGQCFIVFSR